MKSLKKMAELADRFEMKLSRGQQISEDSKAVVADAFFGPSSSGKSEREFQAFILKSTSAFMKALPESVSSCDIGASVDGPAKKASFLVSTNPAVNTSKILAALVADYTKFYGKDPQSQFVSRLAAGDIRPPTVKQSVLSLIKVT